MCQYPTYFQGLSVYQINFHSFNIYVVLYFIFYNNSVNEMYQQKLDVYIFTQCRTYEENGNIVIFIFIYQEDEWIATKQILVQYDKIYSCIIIFLCREINHTSAKYNESTTMLLNMLFPVSVKVFAMLQNLWPESYIDNL